MSPGSKDHGATLRAALPRVALVLALAAVAVWVATHREYFLPGRLEAELRRLGTWAPPAFIGIYICAALLFVPGSLLTALGGALFGPLWGTLWNIIGATLGAGLSFLVARYLAADLVARHAGPRIEGLSEGVAAEGWRFVAFVRLVPVFPFSLLNYALGLTRIGFFEYLIASAVCMLPGAFAYTYLGYAGREAAAHGAAAIRTVAIAIGLLVAAALLPRLLRRFRRTGSSA